MMLTGQRFGKLTAIEATDNRISHRIVWRCQCDCGSEVLATSSHLKSGHTTSCGCARKLVNYDNLTGNRYGRLVAMNPAEERSGNSVMWSCHCDCGNDTVVSAASLKNGNTTSCGCLSSEVHRKSFAAARDIRDSYYVDGTDIKALTNVPSRANTSGVKGVSYDVSVGRWKAYITFKHKRYYLGSSANIDEVVDVRREAESRIHGTFLDWYNNEHKNKPNSS